MSSRSGSMARVRASAVHLRDDIESQLFQAIVGVRTGDPFVAFTYDDGPTPGVTECIGSHLAERGHFATFFVLVDRAVAFPSLILDLVAQGHQIGLHGIGHQRMPLKSVRGLGRELRAGRTRLEDLVQEPVVFMRPPYGAQSRTSFLVARSCGLKVVGWSVDPATYRAASASDVAARLPRSVLRGAVVLLHDGDGEAPAGPLAEAREKVAVDSAEVITDWLSDRGLVSQTLGTLTARYPVSKARWIRGNK